MRPSDNSTLFALAGIGELADRRISDPVTSVPLGALAGASVLPAPAEAFRGKSILLHTRRQLPTVLALLALDGVAARLILAPPDMPDARIGQLAREVGVDLVFSDFASSVHELPVLELSGRLHPAPPLRGACAATEWLFFTSGTTGRPKLVVHHLPALAGAIPPRDPAAKPPVWSTFYDVRRFGGMQILLRALAGNGSLVLSDAAEPLAAFLERAGAAGVTHISGTPSHWRLALMSAAFKHLRPDYVRLSGEIADQALLDHLREALPHAGISHAFASTEAGVAFDVRDGLAGFPAEWIGKSAGGVEMKIEAGSLRIRSPRIGGGYAGAARQLAEADGFVDTGDLVERRGERYHFVGRRGGVINVGGQKVHPEEVEAVLNRHPCVQASRVQARPSPITGALVVASIVLRPHGAAPFDRVKSEILRSCRESLPPHKIPVTLQQVAALDLAPSGKLSRRLA